MSLHEMIELGIAAGAVAGVHLFKWAVSPPHSKRLYALLCIMGVSFLPSLFLGNDWFINGGSLLAVLVVAGYFAMGFATLFGLLMFVTSALLA